MDADNIDPKTDEAIQRIQNSLTRIDTRAEAHKDEQENPDILAGMLQGLAVSARLGTQNSETYKKLAEKEHVTAVLSEAVHAMTSIAIATAAVLKDKHNLTVDRPGYKLLKALAWQNEKITEEAKALGDPNWSTRGLWEIEGILRGKPATPETVEEPSTQVEEEAPYDPYGNWTKYLTPEQLKAVEEHAKKSVAEPKLAIEEEWKMKNRGGW